MKTENKKAILLPEVMKMIIAVICIVLLIYLAVSLYSIFTEKSDLGKAKATLEGIFAKIISMNESKEGERGQYMITSPEDWTMYLFLTNLRPADCKELYCLCICPKKEKEDTVQIISTCNTKGACLSTKKAISFESEDEFLIFDEIPIALTFESRGGGIIIAATKAKS